MMSMTVIVPAYNEAESLNDVIIELNKYASKNGWKVLVINDGSSDGTAGILKTLPGIDIIEHKSNRGYGSSLKTGLKNTSTGLAAFYDADGQHDPAELEKLWNAWSDQDMIVGHRVKGSHFSVSRAPGKWLLGRIANILAGKNIPDLNSGLRIVKRELIIKYLNLFPDGFSFSTTSTIALLSDKREVEYIPVKTRKRIGKSSVKQIRDGFSTILLILRLITLFNPLKIFLPSSIFLIVLGMIYELVWGYFLSPHLRLLPGALLTFLTGVIIFFFALIMDQISQMRRNDIGK